MHTAASYNYNEPTSSPQAQLPMGGSYPFQTYYSPVPFQTYYSPVRVPNDYNEATSPVGRLDRVSNYSFQVRVAPSQNGVVSPQPQMRGLYCVPAYYYGNPSPASSAQFVHHVASSVITPSSPEQPSVTGLYRAPAYRVRSPYPEGQPANQRMRWCLDRFFSDSPPQTWVSPSNPSPTELHRYFAQRGPINIAENPSEFQAMAVAITALNQRHAGQAASPSFMAGSPNASGVVYNTTIQGFSPIANSQGARRALNFENA